MHSDNMGGTVDSRAHGAEGVKRIKNKKLDAHYSVTTVVESKTGFPILPCAPPQIAQKRKEPRESSLTRQCLFGDRVLTGTNSSPLGRLGGLGGVWVLLRLSHPCDYFWEGRRQIGLCKKRWYVWFCRLTQK